MKTITKIAAACLAALALAGCEDDARIASRNLSKAADNFEVVRRIVFYNGITGGYMLSIEGLCSIDTSGSGKTFFVTCKTGPGVYKKHFLGLSDNVTYFAEQMEAVRASAYHYRVTFKPQTIMPDIDFRGSVGAALDATTPDAND
ncbi:hypothetical protein ACMHYJ_14335 [Castellaniella hirudinis]|uniref:beta-sandwich lipoprotein n=1 Tax=Castellaniella hirudinis TaxID=1144617 RepID=UPI0039C4306A